MSCHAKSASRLCFVIKYDHWSSRRLINFAAELHEKIKKRWRNFLGSTLSLSLLINWTACFFIFPSSLSSPSPLAPPLSFFISRIVTWRWKREWIDEIDWLIAAAAARCCRRRCRSNHPLSVCAPFLYRPTKVPKPSHMTTYFARVRDVHH